MSIYGEFDPRFRPRPSAWRVTIVSFCQIVLAVWMTQTLVSVADMVIWRAAKTNKVWIVDAVIWSTPKTELVRLLRPISEDLAFAYDRQYHHLEMFGAAALLLVAIVVGFFATQRTLAARLFALRFTQVLAIFGGAAFPLRKCFLWNCSLEQDQVLPLTIIGVVALAITIFAEWRIKEILGYWFLQVVPAAAAIGYLCYLAMYQTGIFAAGAFIAITFLANVVRKPRPHYEQLVNEDMTDVAAGLLVVTMLIIGASGWAFGFRPLRESRALVVDLRARQLRLEPWSTLAARLPSLGPAPPTSPQKIEIHWTSPAERARRKKPR